MRLLIGTVTTAFLVLAEVTVPNVTISSAMKSFTLPIALVLILNWNDQAYCSQDHHSVPHKKTELAGTQMKTEDQLTFTCPDGAEVPLQLWILLLQVA